MQLDAQVVNKARWQLRPESYFLDFFESPAQKEIIQNFLCVGSKCKRRLILVVCSGLNEMVSTKKENRIKLLINVFLVTFYPSLKPLWSPCQLLQASWNKCIKKYIVVYAFALQFNAFACIVNLFYTELKHSPVVHSVWAFTLLYSVHSIYVFTLQYTKMHYGFICCWHLCF